MNVDTTFAWLGLLGLGALHGINPGMGWLFAVALGLQEKRRSAVWKALGPLAVGHTLSITLAVLLASAIGLMVPVQTLKWIVAAVLFGAGMYRLIRSRHPRWGGMRVSRWDLTVWSFLMATAHGAGLMVLPLFLGLSTSSGSANELRHAYPPRAHDHTDVSTLVGSSMDQTGAMVLAGIPGEHMLGPLVAIAHSAGYLVVTGLVAMIVYEKLGLRLLRTLWFNLDRVWALALILTASVTPFI